MQAPHKKPPSGPGTKPRCETTLPSWCRNFILIEYSYLALTAWTRALHSLGSVIITCHHVENFAAKQSCSPFSQLDSLICTHLSWPPQSAGLFLELSSAIFWVLKQLFLRLLTTKSKAAIRLIEQYKDKFIQCDTVNLCIYCLCLVLSYASNCYSPLKNANVTYKEAKISRTKSNFCVVFM